MCDTLNDTFMQLLQSGYEAVHNYVMREGVGWEERVHTTNVEGCMKKT